MGPWTSLLARLITKKSVDWVQQHWEHVMRKVLRGYAKDRNGNLVLIGTIQIPHSKDKRSPREREDKRHLVRQGATIFKKEVAG